ncbi:class I mannose-6-phosphate isomerase [Pedobacter sp. Hv1]|uniref:class I mannose-6-phosphate isomerase n=1 Tax=Pedobacter sp. Hv1 TaxID=1740090 RepID=UPI0006D8C80E|nr:class I mannose-6-phosphate isomerase [Pedobacter sp. Hv1]KQC02184.1 mannose-6-phosphate isomerase [Pedobacter sp. Hv1]
MNRQYRQVSNYDKFPTIKIDGYPNAGTAGWGQIREILQNKIYAAATGSLVVAVECYPGVIDAHLLPDLIDIFHPSLIIQTSSCMKEVKQLDELLFSDLTDDRIFGFMTRLELSDFFDADLLAAARKTLVQQATGVVLLYGVGATLMANPDICIYADMPRWEAQLRFRRNEVSNLGVDNLREDPVRQYKRAFFIDWRVCDRWKRKIFEKIDFFLDTTKPNQVKLIDGNAMRIGLKQLTQQPFRVMPFFDPGPWGGQWMKEVCGLDETSPNYAWCFDCVPEENSLSLQFGNVTTEIPAINLVFYQPELLLGAAVYGRFGAEFPIRFDFLDTMQGGNLSLQVHPLTEYIREKFGMFYTQDESYYILDAGPEAIVYLGLKNNVAAEQLEQELITSETSGKFDAEKFVKTWPVQKHDHFLIPAGTIHCSGANSMVLEVSATPYIFTFKLWDWNRLGLDGLPRPINTRHGLANIQWNRSEDWVEKNLINRIEKIAEGNGWFEERTGLHETEFIETRRHWFTEPVEHDTAGTVNVLNLIEGEEVLVESPDGHFQPFTVHYAETFIVPASVGRYRISPHRSCSEKYATLKAFVRTKAYVFKH